MNLLGYIAVRSPVGNRARPVTPTWVPRSDILPQKKVVVDDLREARALSGIPIHMLQDFMEISSPTRNFPNVRKLALEGRYEEIVSYANRVLGLKSPDNSNFQEVLKQPSLHKAVSDYLAKAELIRKELEEGACTPIPVDSDILDELSMGDCSDVYL